MKKIIAMSFNSKFFDAGLTLIASIHRHAFDSVDEMVVYDLGLTDKELAYLSSCEKVRVESYPAVVRTFFEGFLEPRQFAWKPWVIKHAGEEGDLVLYLDAGAVILKDISVIFDQIANDGIFLVQDIQMNSDWTTPRALELMGASAEERSGRQLWAGLIGYQVGGRYQNLIDQACQYAQNQEIVCGDRKVHRHDQSIYSILAIRYHCPTQSLENYGEWRGILHPGQVIYVHRRRYKNKKGLRRKTKLVKSV